MSFEAKYPGECWACGEPIEPGQLIESTPVCNYQHVKCPNQPTERPTKFQGSSLEAMGY